MLEVIVSTSTHATKLIKNMQPGEVFTHDGSVFLRIAGEAPTSVYLEDVSNQLQEIGTTPEESAGYFIVKFKPGDYGRIVTIAELKIEL